MREPIGRRPPLGTANVLFQAYRTQVAIRELMRGVYEGTDVTGEEYAILGLVHFFPDRTPTEIAEALGTPPTTISRHVAQLVDKGLVERLPNPEDGRSYLLHATPEGDRATTTIAPRIGERVQALGEVANRPLEEISAALASLEEAIKAVLATER